jgi:hypothetical protein
MEGEKYYIKNCSYLLSEIIFDILDNHMHWGEEYSNLEYYDNMDESIVINIFLDISYRQYLISIKDENK